MSEARRENLLRKGWRSVREAGARRLVLSALLVLLALIVSFFSWALPITGSAERALYDMRLYFQAERNAVEQDPRVVMVVFDDQTLIAAKKRSPLDRGILADALRNLDSLNPKAIGIDILFDQPQDEDRDLIDTLRAMETPVSVGYANLATNEGDIVYEQQLFLEEFMSQLAGSRAHPGSVRLDDNYGVTRRFPSFVEGLPPVLGRAMLIASGEEAQAFPGYTGAIRYRLNRFKGEGVVNKLQIDNFLSDGVFAIPEVREMLRQQIAGRYVLIGGDIVDYDRVPTPLSEVMDAAAPPGLQIHAEMLQQMLDGAELRAPSQLLLWTFTYLIIMMGVLTGLLESRSWRIYLLVALQFVFILGIPVVMTFLEVDTLGVPAFGWVLGWVIAFVAVTSAARAAGAAQRNFAQGALGKYLPREMAEEIIEHPELLALHGEKKDLFVLFSDLEGFTKMSHAIPPEMVAKLLNRYLDMLSRVVLDHGGVIDKFVGDAVVAFWGAPLARADDGMRAARAGYALWQAGEAFRDEVAKMDPDLPKIGKTRVGLHWGEAVVGNFGGQRRIQYTALGDSMNTAARLEAANKALDSAIMASREFADRSGLDWWRAMGSVQLRGRAKPVELMEPAPGFPDEDRDRLARAARFVENDIAAAIALVADVASRYPDDSALANLLKRTRNLEEGGFYALG
ncbi:CHASE2 domain-containing protein [Qipengyuania sp.]|uniref:CHASE2 domain-containing protein n=1 Tax=Qipengyuania sp. TaxID=2004515 RepID=UPI0035C846E6